MVVAMSSRPVAGRHRDAERIGAEQQLRSAPHRHVVRIGDRRVEPDHAVLDRHRRIEAGGARVVRTAHADPADARLARERNRGVRGAAHHEMAHAIIAIDQRRRSRSLGDGDARRGVEAAGTDAADILREAEDAVGIGPGEVRLGHQLGDLGGIGERESDSSQGVGDEGFDGAWSKPMIRVLLTGAVVHQRASLPDLEKRIMWASCCRPGVLYAATRVCQGHRNHFGLAWLAERIIK
jgi:hypothetical protein